VVEVVLDETDRRRTRITMTHSARTEIFAERASRTVAEALRRRLPDLTDNQLARVQTALDQLAGELQFELGHHR
jgi:hypothetical protein